MFAENDIATLAAAARAHALTEVEVEALSDEGFEANVSAIAEAALIVDRAVAARLAEAPKARFYESMSAVVAGQASLNENFRRRCARDLDVRDAQ